MNIYLLVGLISAILIIVYLVIKLYHINEQISFIRDVLEDIKTGNLNRRVLVQEKDITKQICYDINQIAMDSQSQLIRQKQSEQAYKRLMTSLSHDVKTPLSSLVGYLEAVESGLVSGEEKDEYIKKKPAYGRIVCRCETVSEGEILDALRRNPKATDIDCVKRRTRAGMGRCQGGFCMPYVMRLIEKETGKPLTEITKKGGKSNIVTGRL